MFIASETNSLSTIFIFFIVDDEEVVPSISIVGRVQSDFGFGFEEEASGISLERTKIQDRPTLIGSKSEDLFIAIFILLNMLDDHEPRPSVPHNAFLDGVEAHAPTGLIQELN